MANIKGGSLAGGNAARGRVEDDFYATDPKSTELLMDILDLTGCKVLEPCIGQGHIAKVIRDRYPSTEVYGYDIVDRNAGLDNIHIANFLELTTEEITKGGEFDAVVTNPPYKLAQEFIKKSLEIVKDKGYVCMFLKLQFAEAKDRDYLFDECPPKYVYVFSKRQSPWRDGSPVDEKGKPWSSTMCFAWYVWEKGYKGDTILRRIVTENPIPNKKIN